MSALPKLRFEWDRSSVKALVVCVAAGAAFAPMLALYLRLVEPTVDYAMFALVAFLLGIVIVCPGRKRH